MTEFQKRRELIECRNLIRMYSNSKNPIHRKIVRSAWSQIRDIQMEQRAEDEETRERRNQEGDL
jgi:hypothetical protein